MTEPTDEEIMELMPQQMRDDLATAARAMIGFDNPKAAAACRIILNRHAVDHARAVLAKWGRPTPQPVAISERLPEPEDCDPLGNCWAWDTAAESWNRTHYALCNHFTRHKALHQANGHGAVSIASG